MDGSGQVTGVTGVERVPPDAACSLDCSASTAPPAIRVLDTASFSKCSHRYYYFYYYYYYYLDYSVSSTFSTTLPTMSSLFNKLTGHSSDKDTTKDTTDKHHHTGDHHSHSSTTTTQTAGHTTGTSATATTGTNAYGTTGTTTEYTARTGAAYTDGAMAADQMNTNTAATGRTDVYSQRQGTNLTGDDAITRSEEQLRVAKERIETGKAELNKYVTTERVEQAVPVTRERVVIEREPINASNIDKALEGPAISEAHYETTLAEDRVAVAKEVVPIERIRLAKQTETSVETVGAELRKEHVDFTHTALNTADKVEPAVAGYRSNTTTTTGGVPHTKY